MNKQPEALRLADAIDPFTRKSFDNLTCTVAATELRRLHKANQAMLFALEHLVEMTGEPPDRNCSCHISPPCNDCVDYSGWRDAFEYARAAIAKGEQQ